MTSCEMVHEQTLQGPYISLPYLHALKELCEPASVTGCKQPLQSRT